MSKSMSNMRIQSLHLRLATVASKHLQRTNCCMIRDYDEPQSIPHLPSEGTPTFNVILISHDPANRIRRLTTTTITTLFVATAMSKTRTTTQIRPHPSSSPSIHHHRHHHRHDDDHHHNDNANNNDNGKNNKARRTSQPPPAARKPRRHLWTPWPGPLGLIMGLQLKASVFGLWVCSG